MINNRSLAAFLLMVALPAGIAAQEASVGTRTIADTLELRLRDAVQLGLRQNPTYLGVRAGVGVARGELRQARTLPFNPVLEVEAPSTQGLGNTYRSTLSQELEIAGQRGLRSQAAEEELRRAEQEAVDSARVLAANIGRAFLQSLAQQRELNLARQTLALQDRMLEAARIQSREGEISTLEANLVEVERGRAQARVLAAGRSLVASMSQLRLRIGVGPDQPVRLVDEPDSLPAWPSVSTDSLVRLALARRPDLRAATAAAERARAAARLARREAIPNVRIGALLEKDEFDRGTQAGIVFGVPIPVWNRNQGVTDARRAELQRAERQRQAVELQVRADVEVARNNYLAAAEQLTALREQVLEPARANQALLETAYRAGRFNLPTLLLLRNQLVEAELEYVNAWLIAHEALIELEAAIAAPITSENPQ